VFQILVNWAKNLATLTGGKYFGLIKKIETEKISSSRRHEMEPILRMDYRFIFNNNNTDIAVD
jgi:hypothetical protein